MKRISIILLAIVVLNSCNSGSKEEPVIKKQIAAQEKEMLDAIAKYPDSVLLRETLIQYYQDNNNLGMAMKELDNAIKKDSLNPKYWDKRGQLFILKEDTANAIVSYLRAVRLYPDVQFIMSLGWLYAQQKNPAALSMADSLLMGRFNAHAEKEAYLIKGLYSSAIGDKQKAIGFFDKCIVSDYTYMLGYREKAIALYDLQKYNDALAVLQKAVTVQMKFDEGYYWMGRCYEKLGDNADAAESYRTALKISPDFIEAKDALAKMGKL